MATPLGKAESESVCHDVDKTTPSNTIRSMSVRQEFNQRIALLNGAGTQEITVRLVGLLEWMDSQVSMIRILDDLSRGPIAEMVNCAERDKLSKAVQIAAT